MEVFLIYTTKKGVLYLFYSMKRTPEIWHKYIINHEYSSILLLLTTHLMKCSLNTGVSRLCNATIAVIPLICILVFFLLMLRGYKRSCALIQRVVETVSLFPNIPSYCFFIINPLPRSKVVAEYLPIENL